MWIKIARMPFEQQSRKISRRIERVLSAILTVPDSPEGRVVEAMRYGVLGEGKRFRAFLCCATADLFDVKESYAGRVAAAIECVHAYSLIHDDLPCMDDDDMRRGKPALHKAYDEATAILAGDALLALAFEIISDEATHPQKAIRLDIIRNLAIAGGMRGMVGGQIFDLLSPDMELDAGGLTHLQRLKTGALIACAVNSGGILGQATEGQMQNLHAYANDIGLAFQIIDDVLDVEGTQDNLGKTTGKDKRDGKMTFVSLLGVERARGQAEMLSQQAVQHLAGFGSRADSLRHAARFAVTRQY